MQTHLIFLLLCSQLIFGSEALLIRSTPSYVSEWTPMKANSSTAEVTLHHDLQEDPAYVKVEARTESGLIFPAFGSAQQDDDAGVLYGGVVFYYDQTNIYIFVSHYNNGPPGQRKWAAIYTGADKSWIGPQNIDRLYESITVQAKAWKTRDLPPPTWKSKSITLKKGDCLNATLNHTLKIYPDLILVQIRNGERLFQGQGLSSLGLAEKKIFHFGGVLFGANKSHVQLWSGCAGLNGLCESLISIADGWGREKYFLCIENGSITVTAWNLMEFIRFKDAIQKSLLEVETEKHTITGNLTSYNFIHVQLHVLIGANKDFRFDGIGSVMNEAPPYGGLVYGYNDSMVAIWVPRPENRSSEESAVFMLGKIWGPDFKTQMTDDVDIIVTAMDVLVPVCLLEVNTTTTDILPSLQYERYNSSALKFAHGDKITRTCKPGYTALERSVEMVCQPEQNGTWSRTEPDICSEIVCPDPLIMNTNILQSNTAYGGAVLYECATGYRYVSGNLSRACVGEGSWSGTAPLCEATECPVEEVPNAHVITLNNSFGGVFRVSCVDKRRHRHVHGDLVRSCRRNGTWTGAPPVCKECRCPCSAIGSAPIKSNETEKLKQRIKELRSKLSIQKNMTTKARLLKICATDPRVSAKGFGAGFGIGIIVVIFSGIVILDLPVLISILKRAVKRLSRVCNLC